MRQYSYLIFACFCVLTLAQPVEKIIDGGIYYIMGASTGKVLDIYGAFTTEGTNLIQNTMNQGLSQQFNITKVPDTGCVVITSVNSGLVLDVAGASIQQGAQITQWPYNNGTSQQWAVIGLESFMTDENRNPINSTYMYGFTFVSQNSGFPMAVAADTSLDGTNIVQGGTGESVFRLILVSNDLY